MEPSGVLDMVPFPQKVTPTMTCGRRTWRSGLRRRHLRGILILPFPGWKEIWTCGSPGWFQVSACLEEAFFRWRHLMGEVWILNGGLPWRNEGWPCGATSGWLLQCHVARGMKRRERTCGALIGHLKKIRAQDLRHLWALIWIFEWFAFPEESQEWHVSPTFLRKVGRRHVSSTFSEGV